MPAHRIGILLLLLAACAAPPAPEPPEVPAVEATLDRAAAPALCGRARRIFGTACRPRHRGWLPYIRWDCDYYGLPGHRTDEPAVGTWALLTATEAGGTTTASPRPILAAWVLGHGRLEPPLSHPDAPGCQLLVAPTTILPALAQRPPPDPSIGAWSEGDTAYLLLRPLPATLGQRIFVQLAIIAPGENDLLGGVLLSHGVELWIGGAAQP